MTSQIFPTVVQIGPFYKGERPPAIKHTFLDANGDAITLTSFSVQFVVVGVDGADASGMGGSGDVVDATAGIASYTLDDADLGTEGMFRGQIWVGNGTLRYASDVFEYVVKSVTPAPSI